MASGSQRVGLHVSAAGGAVNAPDNAREIGAECFQFFSRSPRGGPAPTISDANAKEFRRKCKQFGFESYIHTPYYINFASQNKGLREAAPRIVREELERGSTLGVAYVVTHLGSAAGYEGASEEHTPEAALKAAAAGLKRIFAGNKTFSSELLLEISAGAGSVIGDTFEELAYLLKELRRLPAGRQVHVCLDTCHLFASGYDLRTKASVADTMKKFRRIVGISRLKLVHANDSKVGLGDRRDRHEHIGRGKIGATGFKAIMAHKDFQNVNFILETKHDNLIKKDIEFLETYRKQK